MSYAQPILAESLAAKIEKLENFELPELFDEFAREPGLVRVLWFLQYVSWPRNYPGGLSRFAVDLIDSSHHHLGPRSLVDCNAERFDLKQAAQVLREMPEFRREELLGYNAELFQEAFLREKHRENHKEWTPQFLGIVTPRAVREMCVTAANEGREILADYFRRLCEVPCTGFRPIKSTYTGTDSPTEGPPWYFARVAEAILEFIERRRARLRARIASTEVTELVTRWIEKSRNTKRAVMISGNSRFGKTEAVKLHAGMHPDSCRLVATPASNALGDLVREVAISLGMEVSGPHAGRDLRERVDYVLRFSHLQLCFDESQLLLPASFSRNTAPARLNWVRRSVMDQGVAAVFVCTPQSYLPAKRRFVKATGFAMEQFDERILKTVQLPEELSEADLLAVARIHFVALSEEYLHFVVSKALATERNYVSDIEKIATLAKDDAREHGRTMPILADIKAAIADVLPTADPTLKSPPMKPSDLPGKTVSKRNATPLQPDSARSLTLPQNRRQMQPVGT